MSLLTSILLILDILCLGAAVIVFVTFMIIALIKKIRKEAAKKYVINALVYSIYCFMGCVVITWIMKMGLSISQKMQAL